MAVDERARHELHTRLEELLGADPATTLMSYLPPVGWADVATRRDLDQLEARLDHRFEEVDHRFEEVDHRFEEVGHRFQRLEQRLEATLHRELNAQTKALFFSLAGLILAVSTLVFGAVRLV